MACLYLAIGRVSNRRWPVLKYGITRGESPDARNAGHIASRDNPFGCRITDWRVATHVAYATEREARDVESILKRHVLAGFGRVHPSDKPDWMAVPEAVGSRPSGEWIVHRGPDERTAIIDVIGHGMLPPLARRNSDESMTAYIYFWRYAIKVAAGDAV